MTGAHARWTVFLVVLKPLPGDEKWVDPDADEIDRAKINLVYTGRLGLSEQGRHASGFIEAVETLLCEHPDVAETMRKIDNVSVTASPPSQE